MILPKGPEALVGLYNLNNCHPFEKYGAEDKETSQVVEDISKRIVAGSCIAFVGAGVSKRSNLPGWPEFIEEMRSEFSPGKTDQLINQYISRNDLISAAELIERSNSARHDFNSVAASFFQRVRENVALNVAAGKPVPNDIHRFITRMPFQKIVTTNYDDLLNSATNESNIIKHYDVERNPSNFEHPDFISRLISADPAIIKLHGTCQVPESMIITRKDYLAAYSGGYLINWLRTNLIQKSFLFVGYSLNDFDIVNLIKEARATLKDENFGHHFAILDRSETSKAHRAYLKECYNITTIADDIRSDHSLALQQMFACIHGKCALSLAKTASITTQPAFALRSTIHEVCVSIRRSVGADHIAIYLTEGVDKINLFGTCKWIGADEIVHFSCPPGDKTDGKYSPTEELKRMFLNMRDCNYFYSGCVNRREAVAFGIPKVAGRYVKSVLILPVASQGKKIGVLVAGSVIERAYTADHYESLAIHARVISESYKTLLKKLNTVRSAQTGFSYDDALSYLSKSRLLNSLLKSKQLNILFYAVDYDSGRLRPYFMNQREKPWRELSYKETYLATEALNSGATLHFKSRDEALQYMRGNVAVEEGLEFFDVSGNFYVTPIRSNGFVSTVLVCWNNSECNKLLYTQFERAKRIVRILFNNPKDARSDNLAVRFLNELDESMRRVDDGTDVRWGKALKNPKGSLANKLVHSALKPLVTGATKLTRVRLWVRTMPVGLDDLEEARARVANTPLGDQHRSDDVISFKIAYSRADENAIRANDLAIDKYCGHESTTDHDDEYTENTLRRYATDPYAREIDPASDDVLRPDKNADKLEKDPKGSWLTVPLVHREPKGGRRLRLIGFLSADDHRFDASQGVYVKRTVDEAERAAGLVAFQRCALDLVAHIVSPLIRAGYFAK